MGRLACLAPAALYAILFWTKPGQAVFVFQDAVDRVWPLALGLATAGAFSICQWEVLRSARAGRLFDRRLATMIAVAPLAIIFVGLLNLVGVSLKLAACAVVVLGVFLFVMIHRPSAAPRWAASGGVALFLTFAANSAIDPIGFPRVAGSFTILAAFTGFVGLLLALLFRYPRTGLVVLAVVVVSAVLSGPNNHRLPTTPSQSESSSVRDSLNAWLDSRRDLEDYKTAHLPYPVILVSSEGGGIFAAAHAYLALSSLAAHCPAFAQHVFAAVGVSGGAIGNALYAAATDPQQRALAPCVPGHVPLDFTPVSADHLSPVLARFLLLEPLDRIVPGQWLARDRAGILTQSFLSVSSDPDYLDQAVPASWDLRSARPAVIAVATSMKNGRRLVLAPVDPSWSQSTGDWWPGGVIEADADVSVIEAASASARFPWITPTALLQSDIRGSYALADGGYFENSGAETILDLINEIEVIPGYELAMAEDQGLAPDVACVLQVHDHFAADVEWSGCERNIFLIDLAIHSSCISVVGQGCGDPDQTSQSFLMDPMRVLLASRSARGALALERASIERCGTVGGVCLNPHASQGFFRSQIEPDELGLPLGWYISREMAEATAAAAVPEALFRYRAQPDEIANDLANLIFHFDLPLYAPGALPSADDLIGSP